MSRPMWCDSFDMDLLRVVPEVVKIVDAFANVKLWTYCRGAVDGVINLPTCWNTNLGLAAFFFSEEPKHERNAQGWLHFRGGYTTDAQLVWCTWLELLRDGWVHQYVVDLDGKVVWRPNDLAREFELLMWHRRGWRTASEEQVKSAIEHVSASIEDACDALAERFGEIVQEVARARRDAS